ncbi:MAG: nucleoside monophosphate kinase [Verrucomicrobia bacterium]|nr:nucleoside monophosphate kinase [Verrucomicrobiota bacterium]
MSAEDVSGKLPAFVLLGAPGSGKGTQGKVLGTIPRFFHCACGDVFRSLDTRSPLGQEFVKYSSRGELVPDELTIRLWKARIDNLRDSSVYKPDIDFLVLDGIPRNVRQAEILDDFIEVHQVFRLSCPDRAELARRMRKRALKENRFDDASEEVIQRRIAAYEAETLPILGFYPADIICQIDASQPPVKVLSDVIGRILQLPAYQKLERRMA